MKTQLMIIGLVLSIVFVTGCAKQLVGNDRDEHGCIPSAGYSWCEEKQKCLRTWEENCTKSKACTEEAKLCPDGTAVGRNSENNCEFDPCPNGTGIANPASVFCKAQGGESKIITAADGSQSGICILNDGTECDEWAYFRGECPAPHVCTDTEKAAEICTMEYMPVCGDDGETYGNKCSACASKNINSWVSGECPEKECGPCPQYTPPGPDYCKGGEIVSLGVDECGCSKGVKCLEKNYCKPEQRTADICPSLYAPVCGWFNQSIQCIKYPCAQNFANYCVACLNENIAYWTEDECPK